MQVLDQKMRENTGRLLLGGNSIQLCYEEGNGVSRTHLLSHISVKSFQPIHWNALWKISNQLIIFLILAAEVSTFKWPETQAVWELPQVSHLRRFRPVSSCKQLLQKCYLFIYLQVENYKEKECARSFFND